MGIQLRNVVSRLLKNVSPPSIFPPLCRELTSSLNGTVASVMTFNKWQELGELIRRKITRDGKEREKERERERLCVCSSTSFARANIGCAATLLSKLLLIFLLRVTERDEGKIKRTHKHPVYSNDSLDCSAIVDSLGIQFEASELSVSRE